MTRARGIDVSQVQGTIDWPAVAAAGFAFAICKATEGGSHIDPMFERNARGARDAGLLVGAYHFLTVGASTELQTKCFMRAVAGVPLDLPLALDVEYPPPEKWNEAMNGAIITARALYIVERLEDERREVPLVYSYPFWLRQVPPTSAIVELAQRTDLWIASYKTGKRVPDEHEEPDFSHWHSWRFWQTHGNVGPPVPGVRGPVDQDVFNGTVEELRPPPPVETGPDLGPVSGDAA